jgi:hypothetical protein
VGLKEDLKKVSVHYKTELDKLRQGSLILEYKVVDEPAHAIYCDRTPMDIRAGRRMIEHQVSLHEVK